MKYSQKSSNNNTPKHYIYNGVLINNEPESYGKYIGNYNINSIKFNPINDSYIIEYKIRSKL